jgi:hypothetical protein
VAWGLPFLPGLPMASIGGRALAITVIWDSMNDHGPSVCPGREDG